MKQSDITSITDTCYVNICSFDGYVYSNMICTTCRLLMPVTNTQPHDQNEVTVYDCVLDDNVTMNTHNILHVTVHNQANIQENNEFYSTEISSMKQEVQRAMDKNSSLDKKMLVQTLQRVGIDVFHVLTVFNHVISHQDIVNNDINESQLSEIINGWIDEIRVVRNNNLKELDRLVKEAQNENASDDDLQDIDQIKQLYRDIPQDIDTTQFKTIEDIVSFWPPLCMPMPSILSECKRYITQERHTTDNDHTILTDEHVVEQLLQSIVDQPGLYGILEEMRSLSNVSPRMITAVKKRLKQLIN